jgi:hypothetical protein
MGTDPYLVVELLAELLVVEIDKSTHVFITVFAGV